MFRFRPPVRPTDVRYGFAYFRASGLSVRDAGGENTKPGLEERLGRVADESHEMNASVDPAETFLDGLHHPSDLSGDGNVRLHGNSAAAEPFDPRRASFGMAAAMASLGSTRRIGLGMFYRDQLMR